ncbi:hypothetical protein KIW84_015581 [Lathyrus oleraceus]|uniref:ABC transporter domain-containing protein n=1 Tax=Pisum sativum TaxID=3888 RepID=A0A9D5BR13_PEA|nr:hypothetical protein KIW84_015581 [Pisum sativum]
MHQGKPEKARKLLELVPENCLLECDDCWLCKEGLYLDALKSFALMGREGKKPGQSTFACSLSACANLAILQGNDANGGVKGSAISQRLEQIYKRLELIDADAAKSRATSLLADMRFSPKMQKKATKTFFGGWRMRIALAYALFIEPDMLLLEPTNHFDLHAVL